MLVVCPIRKIYSISEIFGSCINSIFCGSGECQYTLTESSRSIEMMVTKDGSNLDNYGQTDTASHWQMMWENPLHNYGVSNSLRCQY